MTQGISVVTIQNIPINRTSAQGATLAALLAQLWNASNLATQILNQMQNQTDGSNYGAIETQWGLPSGQGSNVYGLVFAVANGNPSSPSGFGAGAFTQLMGRLN
jgi:hypothetical protein